MENNEYDEFCLHNDAVSAFNNELYSGIFTEENLVSKKKAIKLNGEKFYGYFLEKNKEQFFASADYIKSLPFKVDKFIETDYKGDVFKVITTPEPIAIPAENRLTFRELVDMMCRFKHSNKLHQLLFNITALVSYIDRINVRISTDAGFGKDSAVSIIAQLVDSTYNLYGGTFAKLEYALINKLIVLNELGNLKADDKVNFQEFLLATGAYFNTYTKRTRKTGTTQEEYDISKLSLMIFYNLPEYYRSKNQEYFDEIFTRAVTNRFIPFVFKGQLTSSFENVFNTKEIMERNREKYKDFIASINYFRQNNLTNIKYDVPDEICFSDDLKRYDRTFNVVLKYVASYASDQEEFNVLAKELFKCYLEYGNLVSKEIEE